MTSQNYMKVLMNESCFARKTLLDTMRNCGEQISDALFKVRLQDMLRSGDIIRVGRNAYCILKENMYSYEYDYSDRAKEVAEKIQSRYPYLEFTIFETAQLNEFVNHQLAHNIIFVSVESELKNFVFDALKEEYPGKVLVNPTPDIYHQYWYGDMIVIEHLITEAPKDKNNVWASRLEKILVDIQTDPILLERTVYAFGLLEAIARVGMPFIFKGRSSLMLLLKEPKRLSTDIDIIVAPGTPVDEYLEKASIIFPFSSVTEQKRIGKNNIEKRHFKFTYDSPINDKPFYILLDRLFEDNQYANLVKRPIRHSLLLTEPDDLEVYVPDADCILGDKLTAFAPHTTGIPLNADKDIEVIKQLYDICSLLEVFQDFDRVSMTYEKVVKAEIDYRGVQATSKDTLLDTFKAAACVGSRGAVYGEEYSTYMKGIRDLRDHIYSERYSPEIAAVQAVRVMYMAVCLMTGQSYKKISDYSEYMNMRVHNNSLVSFKYLKKVAPPEYAYLIQTDRILDENGIVI